MTWADAHLTDKGIKQAQTVNAFWKQGLVDAKIPAPQSYYTSPLHRCLATAYYTFTSLSLPSTQAFVPEVKEASHLHPPFTSIPTKSNARTQLLRETNGEHTCDRRSTLTYIRDEFPTYTIEQGFSEQDQLWRADWRESHAEHVVRMRELLADVFEHDASTFVSFTSHSGSIASLLDAVGHREFRLPTGGVIPVFVKAVRV